MVCTVTPTVIPPSAAYIHCVDRIYCDAPSARIGRLIPIWKQPSDGRLHTAASQEKNLRLTAAYIRLSRGVLNACLIPIQKQLSRGRLHTAISRYIEQPPHSPPANGRLAV